MDGIVAILVNFNGFTYTKDAVYSLLKQKLSCHRIIVVDNFSSDNSCDELRNEFSGNEMVVILRSDRNGGFAYGNNFGIKYAIHNFQFEFILLINNDTLSDPNVNLNFMEFYCKNKASLNIGILTGKIYYLTNGNLISSAGGYISKYRGVGKHIGINEVDTGQYDDVKSLTFATACLWFFHKSLIDEVGYLPEEYFMYIEDVDYCMAVLQRKKTIIYVPQVKIWHKVGGSSNLLGNIPNYRLIDGNRFILAKKYFNVWERFLLFMFLICKNSIGIVRHTIKDRVFVNTFAGFFPTKARD
jgi:GT2 family glycosyltransferase